MKNILKLGLMAAAITSAAALAQGDRAHDNDHDHGIGAGIEGARLIVSDAGSNVVRVLDAESGAVVGTFTVPGSTGGNLAVTGSGQYAVVSHRDANRVSVIHSGLLAEDHGDHAHLLQVSPYVVATMNVGLQPSHLVSVDHRTLVFNDGDGSIAILDENLFGLSLAHGFVDTVGPDHGAPLLIGDFVLSGQPGTEGVDVYGLDGNLTESVDGCPGLHGAALVGRTGVFGCRDGVLLARLHGDHFRWQHVPNPTGAADGARVATLYGSIGELAVGNFGAAVALIDVGGETITTVDLRGSVFAAAVTSGHVVALTSDGTLSLVSVQGDGTAEVKSTLPGVVPAGSGDGRPAIAARGNHIFITNPSAGEVVVVHLYGHEIEVGKRFSVPGNPAGIGVLMIEGNFETH